jgi:hypothetical protein
MNNRVTGALTTMGRPEVENGETAAAQQLSLIEETATQGKVKKGKKQKAKAKK